MTVLQVFRNVENLTSMEALDCLQGLTPLLHIWGHLAKTLIGCQGQPGPLCSHALQDADRKIIATVRSPLRDPKIKPESIHPHPATSTWMTEII